ncbi:MAG: hypothetical protein KAV87_52750 [Desulfobacteraceae bacterium]|nr:hypothetical protein [Desulfobacteraceae bacterium]
MFVVAGAAAGGFIAAGAGASIIGGAALGATIGGAVGGIASGKKAGKEAGRAASAVEKGAEFQTEIAAAQWDRYMEGFATLEDKLVEEVSRPLEDQPGTKRALATIDRGYADVTGNLRRTLGGRYQYGGGLERGNLLNLERQRIGAKAGAVAGAEADLFNRRTQVANIGRGLPGQAVGAAGSAANIQGSLANIYSGAAKGAWDSVGTGIGNLAQLYTLSKTPTTAPTTAPTPAPTPQWTDPDWNPAWGLG